MYLRPISDLARIEWEYAFNASRNLKHAKRVVKMLIHTVTLVKDHAIFDEEAGEEHAKHHQRLIAEMERMLSYSAYFVEQESFSDMPWDGNDQDIALRLHTENNQNIKTRWGWGTRYENAVVLMRWLIRVALRSTETLTWKLILSNTLEFTKK